MPLKKMGENDQRTLDILRKYETIKKVRSFMFEDLEKTIALKDSAKGGPNFLLALVLCEYTEFWGKLLSKPDDGGEVKFNVFFKRLGKEYEMLLSQKGNAIYGKVRSGLAHAYLVEGNALVRMATGICGLEYESERWTFNILTYFEDFKRAVNVYINDLLLNKHGEWERFETVLKDDVS